MDFLEELNPPQQEAVQAVAGPLLILAGPGSGKTRVITYRIAYLIGQAGVRPHNILAVTFTNKAAREMMGRLQTLVPGAVERLTIGTFHAVCARLLRREGKAIGLDSGFSIYDDDDQISVVRDALADLNVDEKKFAPRAILSAISAAKSELRGPLEYGEHASGYLEEVILRVYRRYQELLAERSALDFDDLLMTTVRLFREAPAVLEKYQERYQHVLVDEFQDTNVAQYAVVKQLASKHRNICVVGDPDQSIYAWRRADIRNILNFEADFPGCRTVLLEQNYRSTKTILAAAQAVISQNQLRKDKRLWTENEEGVPVTVREAYNDEEEAGFVVSEIERLVARGEVRLRDCAVMYRTNAQSRKLEEVFLRRRMPHRVVGIRFYQRREIKDVVAYLRCLANPDDAVSLLRIINVPARGVGQKTLAELQRWAERQGLSIYRALLRLASDEDVASAFSTRTERQLVGFISMMEELRAASADQSLLDLLKLVLDRTGYASMLKDDASEEGEDRLENVEELLRVAGEFAGMRTDAGLAAFLEEAALATDVDEYDENADAVALITLHAAKGLEFPAVFIVGMEDGIFPHARSLDDPKAMEEERRLCYVGITRAKRRLYLVYAAHRTLYGNTVANVPSRFLADIPSPLAKGSLPTKGRGPATSRSSMPRGTTPGPLGRQASRVAPAGASADQAPARPAARPSGPRFAPGDRVRHATFGEGIVVKSTLVKDDEEVEVAFPRIGVKKLSTAFAPLEKL